MEPVTDDGTCWHPTDPDPLAEIKRVPQREWLIAKVRQFLPRQVQAWFDELAREAKK